MIYFLALIQLINGSDSSNGLLKILYQGEWFTTCQPNRYNYFEYFYYYSYYSAYNNHADVVCKELGYDKGAVVFDRRRVLPSERQYRLWHNDLYCEGTENSLYDCKSRYYEVLSYRCSYIPTYSCQSMNTIAKYICIIYVTYN